ncbi:heat shock protein IbpA [compost metagenome]
MTTAFSLAPLFRHSVGFDRFNDLFESAARNEAGSSYPPYNVEKHGEDQGCADRDRWQARQWRC